jgi:bacteriorhodopsin
VFLAELYVTLHLELGLRTANSKIAILAPAGFEMNAFRQQRAWFWIAIAAIVIAFVALLVPHGSNTDAPAWMALLPAFFVGLLVPFTLLPLLPVLSLGHTHEAPSLAPSFQRPPPFRIT